MSLFLPPLRAGQALRTDGDSSAEGLLCSWNTEVVSGGGGGRFSSCLLLLVWQKSGITLALFVVMWLGNGVRTNPDGLILVTSALIS